VRRFCRVSSEKAISKHLGEDINYQPVPLSRVSFGAKSLTIDGH